MFNKATPRPRSNGPFGTPPNQVTPRQKQAVHRQVDGPAGYPLAHERPTVVPAILRIGLPNPGA